MAQPLVSIITPAYRAQDFIVRPVKSVLAQIYKNWEMIIIADDQFDYQNYLRDQNIKDARIRHAATGGVASGVSQARNAGLRHARGDVIAYLDADDAFSPERLARLTPLAVTQGVVLSNILFRDHATGGALENLSWPHHEGNVAAEDLPWISMHANVPLIYDRKRVNPAWDEQQRFLEDLLFMVQLFDAHGGVYYVPEPSYHYYRRQGSVCNSADAAQRFLAAIDRLERPLRHLKNPILRATMEDFLHFQRAAEVHFDAAVQRNPAHTFQESLKALMAQRGRL